MTGVAEPFEVREFATADGRVPVREWLADLDRVSRVRILARIARVAGGNLGDCRAVGEGVLEARLAFGPGYRVYFGRHGRTVVLLLLGGSKATQFRDIHHAKMYWRQYRESI